MSSLIQLMCQSPARSLVRLSGTPTNPNIMPTTVVNDPTSPTNVLSGWGWNQFGEVKNSASHDGVTLTDDIFAPDVEWIDPVYRTGGFLPGSIATLYYLRVTTISGTPPLGLDGVWQQLAGANFSLGFTASMTWVAADYEWLPGYVPDVPPVTKEGVCKVEISLKNDGTDILAVGYYGGGVTLTNT